MNAKGHVITGITTAATAGLVVANGDGLIMSIAAAGIAAGTSLLTSQLPDIDSPNSKISQKVPIGNWIKNVWGIIINAIISIASVLLFVLNGTDLNSDFFKAMIICVGILSVHIGLIFLLRHRKGTHTLIANGAIAALVLYPYFNFSLDKTYLYLATGIIAGYAAHLIYDTATVRGCPLLYPFSTKMFHPLKFLQLKSGKYDMSGCVFSVFILITTAIIMIFV